jgi:hypothetical protein
MLQDFFRLSGDIDINHDFFNPIKHPFTAREYRNSE